MADNYIVSITAQLNLGNLAGEFANASKQASASFESNFNPDLEKNLKKIDYSKLGEKSGQQFGEGWTKAAKSTIQDTIEKGFQGVDLGKSGFAKHLERTVTDAVSRVSAPPGGPQPNVTPSAPPAGYFDAREFERSVKPFISSIEAFSMLMRGEAFASVARKAREAYTEYQERAKERKEGGPVVIPERAAAEAEARAASVISNRTAAAMAAAQAAGAGGGAAGLASRLPGVGGAAVAGGMLGGGGGGLGAGIGMAIGGPPGAVAGFLVGKGLQDTIEYLKELSEKTIKLADDSAETTVRWHDMAETMGFSGKQFSQTALDFAKHGMDIDHMGRQLTRIAVTASREMPEVERKVADEGNVIAETNIKVAQSHRAVEKAIRDRGEAADHVVTAEGELIKVQETGIATRQQQAEGAAQATQQAETRAKAARVQAQFAPEEQRLTEARAPLTEAGAKLGIKGAGIGVEEAEKHLREVISGEKEDPGVTRERELRKAQLNVETALQNKKNARLHLEEVQEAEAKRQAMPSGEELARQQEAAAALAARRAAVAQRNLEIEQAATPYAAQQRAAQNRLADARDASISAEEGITTSKISEKRLTDEQQRLRFHQISRVQEDLQRMARGERVEGFRPGEVPQGVMRGAIERQGAFLPGPMMDFMGDVFRGAKQQGMSRSDRLNMLSSVFQSRMGDREEILDVLEGPRGPQNRRERQVSRQIEQALTTGRYESAEEYRARVGVLRTGERMRDVDLGAKAQPAALGIMQVKDLAGAVSAPIKESATSFAGTVVKAAGDVASIFRGIMPATTGTTPSSTVKGERHSSAADTIDMTEPATAAGGGLLTGPGSELSDSIPINASHGEYVVKAEAVRNVGVPFLNDINEGRIGMQDGGSTDDYASDSGGGGGSSDKKEDVTETRAPLMPSGRGLQIDYGNLPAYTGPVPSGESNIAVGSDVATNLRGSKIIEFSDQLPMYTGSVPLGQSKIVEGGADVGSLMGMPISGVLPRERPEMPAAAAPSAGKSFMDALFSESKGAAAIRAAQPQPPQAGEPRGVGKAVSDYFSDPNRYQFWPEYIARKFIGGIGDILQVPEDIRTGKLQVTDPATGMPTREAIAKGFGIGSTFMGARAAGIMKGSPFIQHGANIVSEEIPPHVLEWLRHKKKNEDDDSLKMQGGGFIPTAGGGGMGLGGGAVDMGAVRALEAQARGMGIMTGPGSGGGMGGGFGDGGGGGGFGGIGQFLTMALSHSRQGGHKVEYRMPNVAASIANAQAFWRGDPNAFGIFGPEGGVGLTIGQMFNAQGGLIGMQGGGFIPTAGGGMGFGGGAGARGPGPYSADASAFSDYHPNENPEDWLKKYLLEHSKQGGPMVEYRMPDVAASIANAQAFWRGDPNAYGIWGPEGGVGLTIGQMFNAQGGLIEGFAEGGMIDALRNAGAGPAPVSDEGAYGQLSQKAANILTYVMGGGGGFADSVANASSFYSGSSVPQGTLQGVASALSYHQLDIRTPNGSFSAAVSDDTLQAIQSSALGSKLTQIGPRPTWFS